jgi:maleylacetate reductase
VIVRWGLEELPSLLEEAGVTAPLLVTTPRWAAQELPVAVPAGRRFDGVLGHAPPAAIAAAAEAARAAGADGLLALGGGSAIDTAKAASAATGLPVVSIPTTYSGAEWTTGYGSRDPVRRIKEGAGGARTVAILYEPRLTLSLPLGETVGTALNALDHAAEALYVPRRSDETDADALAGARLIAEWLPRVVAAPGDLEARTGLLEGARHAGAAMRAGTALAHALAQALGGRTGGSHGGFNAVVLPAVLRFNAAAAPEALAALAGALGVPDAAGAATRAEELALLGGFARLRSLGVDEGDLPEIAAAALERPAARLNPRPATADDVLALLRSAW